MNIRLAAMYRALNIIGLLTLFCPINVLMRRVPRLYLSWTVMAILYLFLTCTLYNTFMDHIRTLSEGYLVQFQKKVHDCTFSSNMYPYQDDMYRLGTLYATIMYPV